MLTRILSICFIVAIFGALALIIIGASKNAQKFTEFYMLGINGQAQDYPTEYIMNNGKISQVLYDNGTVDTSSESGIVILGIINQTQQTAVYCVKMAINGYPVSIELDGTSNEVLGPIKLQQGQKWEQEIGIVPNKSGDNQEVELFLFKDGENTANDSLHLWINVKQIE